MERRGREGRRERGTEREGGDGGRNTERMSGREGERDEEREGGRKGEGRINL